MRLAVVVEELVDLKWGVRRVAKNADHATKLRTSGVSFFVSSHFGIVRRLVARGAAIRGERSPNSVVEVLGVLC